MRSEKGRDRHVKRPSYNLSGFEVRIFCTEGQLFIPRPPACREIGYENVK
jgi:hypothetical protein